MRPAYGHSPPHSPRALANVGRRLALVVDDDIEMAGMTAMALSTQGWRTIVANDPLAAAALARDLPVDVLVTDVDMAGMSGADLAAVVRVHHPNLPVILVTAEPIVELPMVEPPFMFIAKPFRLRILFAVIESLAGSGDAAARRLVS